MKTWPRQVFRGVGLAVVLGAAVLLGLGSMAPSSVWAEPSEMAVIETRASLEDESSDGINAALRKALEKAIRGAAAMGLGQARITGAYRGPSFVVIQILATSETEEGAKGDGPRVGEALPGNRF
jgi:hypothetical protein